MTDSNQNTSTAEGQSPSPKWVEKMHEHFREKGFFRAEDLQRLLGDPGQHVAVQASTDLRQLTRTIDE